MRSETQRRKKKISRPLLIVLIVVLLAVIACETAGLYFYSNIRSSITVEAGEQIPPAEEFLIAPRKNVEALSSTDSIDSSVPGEYPITFRWNFLTKTAKLIVQDTKAPALEVRDILTSTGRSLVPEDFVTVLTDATEVKLSYREAPDFNTEGLQPVTIIATDAAGNQTAAVAQMALYNDSEAPVIKGAVNRTIYVKESISYKNGIEVTDNLDPQPKLTIDNTLVNPDEPGSYPVTYTASDFVGNTSSVTITITVEPTPTGYEYIEKLNAKADRLLAQIIKPEMTEIERAYAVFRWVRVNVEWYAGRTDHNYVDQAIKALDGEPGDCYTCAAVCKVLLERAGFEAKFMEREGAPGQHYWVMLKVGGEWYHMDPSPIYVHQFICFLGTDEQLLAFHETRANYYAHDWSKYPATPETSPAKVVVKNGRYTLVVEE